MTKSCKDDTPHSHMTLRASCHILANVAEAADHAIKVLEQVNVIVKNVRYFTIQNSSFSDDECSSRQSIC